MYPAHVFSLFPPFPREDTVFVAMPFEDRFKERWEKVLKPAVHRVYVNGKRLKPKLANTRDVSDSILTEITTGIASCRLVFADVTTIGYFDEEQKKPIRNVNVMYEVGLAQAVRLPEEVILFRSDKDPLPFDTSHILVKDYSPDTNPGEAQELVKKALIRTLRELELQKHLAVQKAVDTLDYPSWMLLFEARVDGMLHPKIKTMRDALGNADRLSAISRLLELGALRAKLKHFTPELVEHYSGQAIRDVEDILTYECTEFGDSVAEAGAESMGLRSQEMQEYLNKMFSAEPKE